MVQLKATIHRRELSGLSTVECQGRARKDRLGGRFRFLHRLLPAILLLLSLSSVSLAAAETYQFERLWPEVVLEPSYQAGIAVDAAGAVYVANGGRSEVVKLSADLKTVTSVASPYFSHVALIAVDSQGNLIVSNSTSMHIQKVSPDGRARLALFGPVFEFPDPSRWKSTLGLALDVSDNVYALTEESISGESYSVKYSLVRLDPQLANPVELTWQNTDNRPFYPRCVAVDKEGMAYILGTSPAGTDVLAYDQSGVLRRQWRVYDPGSDQSSYADWLTLDNESNVYVILRKNGGSGRILKFDRDGTFLGELIDGGAGSFYGPISVAIGSTGNAYVLDRAAVAQLSPRGKIMARRDFWNFREDIISMAVDPAGNIYAANVDRPRTDAYAGPMAMAASPSPLATYRQPALLKFAPDGTLLPEGLVWDLFDGEYIFPKAVAADSEGNIYVLDANHGRVLKFDPNGIPLSHRLPWSASREFHNGSAMAVDGAGNIYVADSFVGAVLKFDTTGNYLTQWGIPGTGRGEFDAPTGLAVDHLGNVYVVDAGGGKPRIQKFDPSGTFLAQWDAYYAAPKPNFLPYLDAPTGIAVDSSGTIFLADRDKSRILQFNQEGALIGQWGTLGLSKGQFAWPTALAVDATGSVFVGDSGNRRIQKFVRANKCAATVGADMNIHIPIARYKHFPFSADMSYIPDSPLFTLQGYTGLSDTEVFSECSPATLSRDLRLHIPSIVVGSVSYWLDLQYAQDASFTMVGAGEN